MNSFEIQRWTALPGIRCHRTGDRPFSSSKQKHILVSILSRQFKASQTFHFHPSKTFSFNSINASVFWTVQFETWSYTFKCLNRTVWIWRIVQFRLDLVKSLDGKTFRSDQILISNVRLTESSSLEKRHSRMGHLFKNLHPRSRFMFFNSTHLIHYQIV